MYSIFSPQNIKTNTSSMMGQYSLQKNNANLSKNIVELSTGIRINSGRDDPTGFVASSILTKEITSMTQAVSNCQTANSLCATADSALMQISNMLNDIRSLVSEAANTGVENEEMIAALQLQVDANLDSIDRIANSTQFIDKKLLDGSLDFVTYGLDKKTVDYLQINQANFLGQIEKDIVLKVLTSPRQAELFYNYLAVLESTTLTVGGKKGMESLPFAQGATLENIADSVNQVSDSTGIGARVQTQATNGTITLTSAGLNNDILLTASKAGSKEGNFVVRYTAPREGNDQLKLNYTEGTGNDPGIIEIVLETAPTLGTGPVEVKTTAEQVVHLINNASELRDANGDAMVGASLPDCNTGPGTGTVTPFDQYAYYGDLISQNSLQFLAAGTPPDIQFSSTPGQPLSLDFTSHPAKYGNAAATVQGFDPGTSFTLKTIAQTAAYDGVSVIFSDSPAESVGFDAAKNAVVFHIDFSGRAAATPPNPINMNELQQMVSDDPVIGNTFVLLPEGTYDSQNPPTLSSGEYLGLNAEMSRFSGGLIDPGTLIVNLETDEKGIIRTTANDLIAYFDYPTTQEEADFLAACGLSVSNLCGSDGSGFLRPTYDPEDCPKDITNMSPNITFMGFGWDDRDVFASGTTVSSNGADSAFTVTAKKQDDTFTGAEIQVVYDETGPNVSYDVNSSQLTVGVNPAQPVTAAEIAAMINSDPKLSTLFTASLPASVSGGSPSSDGSGFVAVGDHGTLSMPPRESAGAPMLGNSDHASVGLVFYSLEYGSSEFVNISSAGNTYFPVTDRYGNVVERAAGTDITATINNQLAVGVGREASISTTDLDMSLIINGDVREGTVTGFRITGGGALMQLGPYAEPSQQTRLAFRDVHTAAIGGTAGKLSQIRLGGEYDLSANTRGAYSIVEESIRQIATFRGQIGSFQKYEISRNIDQMTDNIEIASLANSEIKDTDFAAAISEMTRNQLLIESTTNVLRYPTDNMRQLLQMLGR
ncbi:MAG: hypothetical protein LBQ54_01400 [Planctomycetaceae bacterium]|jgi:flagellin-like hook-associated protein FlgL|nr:hypothetical protein [Planctomycetaceae bacterium]